MCKPMQELIDQGAKYRTRNGGLVQVTKIKGRSNRDNADWATVTVLEPGPDSIHGQGEEYAVSAYGGYYETDDPDIVGYDLMELVTDETILKGVMDERDFALADAKRLQSQLDTANVTISALNEQLVQANQRFYAMEANYKEAFEANGRLETQISVLYNKQKDTDEREKLLTFQREQQQNEIDQFQGILDKLQAMHNVTEEELAREKSHVNYLMRLMDITLQGAARFVGPMAPPPPGSFKTENVDAKS